MAIGEQGLAGAEWLLANWDALRDAATLPWSRLQPLLVSEGIGELLALGDARSAIGQSDPSSLSECRCKMALPPHELNPPPLLTGDDLVALGIPRGKIYAWLLQQVRDAQLDGVIRTKEESLRLVSELLKSRG